MKTLNDKIILVTGGSRGIGASIVRSSAAEGATVVFTYSSSDDKAKALVDEVRKSGSRAIAVKADSANPDELRRAVEDTIADLGHIDILVNNAGIYIGKDFDDHTLEDYQTVMAVNVQAVFVASQAAIKAMPRGGRIITIGSNMADNSVGPQTTLYTMSKSALQGFTRGLARDLGPKGITVNLVQPGPVNTDMNPSDTELADFLRSRTALGEYGSVEDIAGFVNFLAGAGGKYLTGAILTIDGGFNA